MRIDMLKHLHRSRDDSSTAPANNQRLNFLHLLREKFTKGVESDIEKKTPSFIPSSTAHCYSGVGEEWISTGNSNRRNNCEPVNGNARVLKQSGATLPRSARRHTTHVSFDQVPKNAPNKSILKSPIKLPPGRIEIIKEEVELQVASSSHLTATMHRSIETSNIPPPVPPPLHPSSFPTALQMNNGRNVQKVPDPSSVQYPIYSEPATLPSIGSKLRSDYYNSQGSHLQYNEDDAGVMSEADTTSTGFRRGGKARSSLPIVSKTLEKPLGLVFLQFHEETKRAVLPNEITTFDTVKALFVRAFPKGLTMQSFDSHKRKIYILDQRKDMFYELEDLRDIRDRSVLKIFEADQLSAPLSRPLYSDEMNYFSEPEFDSFSETSHRNAVYSSSNKFNRPLTTSISSKGNSSQPYLSQPSGFVPPVPPKPQRSSYGYVPIFEEPLYANTIEKRPPSRSGTVTPIVDEEARYRVDAMERHLASLTGLVQQALSGKPGANKNPDYANLHVPQNRTSAQKDANSVNVTPSVCGPVKLTKSATHDASNESQPAENGPIFIRYPDAMLMEYLESVQSRVKEMRNEARSLRRHTSAQSLTMREIVKENFERLQSQFNLLALIPSAQQQSSKRTRTSNEIQMFKQEATRLTREIQSLEANTEELKTSAVNGQSLISLRDVERGTIVLNELSNQLSDLRLKLPELQERIKVITTTEMESIIKDEVFLKEEPEELDELAKRCKKLTATLLNLNKLANVQEYKAEEKEHLVDLPPNQTNKFFGSPLTAKVPEPPARRESLASSDSSSQGNSKKIDKKAQDMLDDLLSELEVFTDISSREDSPEKESTIKRSPKNGTKFTMTQSSSDGYTQLSCGLSPPSITPSNSTQSTATTASTLSSVTDNSSLFSTGSDSATLSKVQVGVGDSKATVTSRPSSRKPSDAEKSLADWLCNISTPPLPQRGTSKSPMSSPSSKTGGFFTLPGYSRTVSEPGDYQGANFSDYANLRELRSPNIKDQRLTPQQQEKIGSYYTSKLRKGSDPGTDDRELGDFRQGYFAGENIFAAAKEPPVLPPKPGKEDSSDAPPLPPRNRQQALEERHQELLRKQRQLQEQYARLQQLQRDQKTRASSPSSRTMTSPSSGSMNDLKRQHLSKLNNNDHYATLPTKSNYQITITNGETSSEKIYETDIL